MPPARAAARPGGPEEAGGQGRLSIRADTTLSIRFHCVFITLSNRRSTIMRFVMFFFTFSLCFLYVFVMCSLRFRCVFFPCFILFSFRFRFSRFCLFLSSLPSRQKPIFLFLSRRIDGTDDGREDNTVDSLYDIVSPT